MLKYIVIFAAALVGCRGVNEIIYKYRTQRRKKEQDIQNIEREANNDGKTKAVNTAADSYMIEAAASQILGTRKNQEDSYYISSGSAEFDLQNKSYLAAAVCDGMGGLSAGEVASRIAVECIEKRFKEFTDKRKLNSKTIPDFLKDTALAANEAVKKYSAAECGGQMCGTTMVFALLESNDLYWISAGDSRIYLIRDEEIAQITHDHNYAYTLDKKVQQGLITREEAMNEPKREALISYIGIQELELVDLRVTPVRLKHGDVVLLCSDGLTKVLSDDYIRGFINQHKDDIDELAEMLPIEAENMCFGSQDNTTVAVVKYV